METANATLSARSEPISPVDGLLQTMVNLFGAPPRAFLALRARRWWVMPFLLCVATAVLFQLATARYRMQDLKQEIRANPSYSSEEVGRRIANIDRQATSGVSLRQLALATGFLSAIHGVKLFGLALAIWLPLQLYSVTTTYMTIVSVCSFVFLIKIPEAVIAGVLTLLKGTARVFLGPAVVLPSEWFQSALFNALDRLDVFSLWIAILLVTALPIVAGLSRKKSALMVAYLWIVWVIAGALFGGLVRIS